MRVNVYHEEITGEIQIVWVEPREGVRYCGVRFMLKSAKELHHSTKDDDRSAVTFWVGSLNEANQLIEAVKTKIAEARAESARVPDGSIS